MYKGNEGNEKPQKLENGVKRKIVCREDRREEERKEEEKIPMNQPTKPMQHRYTRRPPRHA